MTRRSSLTGGWSGAYRYAGGHETVFNAQIEDAGGVFVGTTQEPNEFLDSTDAVLHGAIDGRREGQSITFTKFYHHGSENARHSIRYEGAVNDQLTCIEGRWTVSPNWSGTFFMVRDDDGPAAKEEAAVEESIEVRR